MDDDVYKFEDCPIIKESRLQATVIIYKLDILFEDTTLGLPRLWLPRQLLLRCSTTSHPCDYASLYLGNCSRRNSTSSILGVVLYPYSRVHRPKAQLVITRT